MIWDGSKSIKGIMVLDQTVEIVLSTWSIITTNVMIAKWEFVTPVDITGWEYFEEFNYD